VKFREPFYVRISPSGELPDIQKHATFRAVVILDGEYDQDWQTKVSRWLVDSGCLCLMAWGPNCETWDDSVDHANLDAFDWGEIPDDKFVMTSWHENETLEDVFWFCQFCAENPDFGLGDTLLIHVGERDRGEEFYTLFVNSRDLAEREAGGGRSIN